MSDYFGEESPWAQPSTETGLGSFEAHLEDGASPWGNAAEDKETDDEAAKAGSYQPHSVLDPYDDTPYGDSLAPLVSGADTDAPESHESNLGDAATKSEVSTNAERVPDLKPTQRRNKSVKKKRAGEIKSESVESDPLATSMIQFDNVVLASDSVANLRLSPTESEPKSQPAGSPDVNPANSWAKHDPLADSLSTQKPTSSSKRGLFAISVGDPLMVGEMTNVHTEYTIQMTTTSEFYEVKEATVQRRYRDFRWLYRTLEHNHPGVVVPPPPEKQALGRFNDDFVQQRRAALEQMLRKITLHPLLVDDADLRAFLTSADFADYLQTRLMADSELEQATRTALNYSDQGNGGGWNADSGSGAGAGFLGTLGGALSLSRGVELDPWTIDKRNHLDKVESQLKEVCKELVSISMHRQQLSDALGDFANVTRALGEIEATRRLSGVLRSFAKVHDRLAQIYVRQRQQNLLTLEFTLDEHLRTVGSVRDALSARQKVFSAAENASSEVEKRQLTLDKLVRQSRTQEDRVKALEEEIAQLSQMASQLHDRAADIARLVEKEISRVNEEKIEDFRNSVEIYLENTVETQKETIEIWETFYTQNFAST